jgi:hypothetical protein
MIAQADYVNYDGTHLVLSPKQPIDRETRKHIQTVEIYIHDGRQLSPEQRKKIFSLIGEISKHTGDADPDYIRGVLTWDFCTATGNDPFSLSRRSEVCCDMSTAREFLTWLIGFCFDWNVPTKDTMLCYADDTEAFLWKCLWYRKCAICQKPAEVHHVNRVGMGRDREKIVHVGLNAIALCREHHNEADFNEKELFEGNYVFGIKLDERLCERLRLNTENKRVNGG